MELQADAAVVDAAVKQDGFALRFAAAELQNDRKVVLAAVEQSGLALRFASAELRADKQIVRTAREQTGRASLYVSAELHDDLKANILGAISRHGGSYLEHAPPELQGDKEVVLAAVRKDGGALAFASTVLQSDKEIVLAAGMHILLVIINQKSPERIHGFSDARLCKIVVTSAVKQDAWALIWVTPGYWIEDPSLGSVYVESLKQDKEVIEAAGGSCCKRCWCYEPIVAPCPIHGW
eukprot:SAG31_NODE_1140_length_9701_cov_43.848261_6_plen_237_part_00